MGGNDNQQPIIVKRVKKNEAGAHGGAWKLAYADPEFYAWLLNKSR